MELLLNELSLHGQFANVQAFEKAIDTVMVARNKMRQFGGELRCHRSLAQVKISHQLNLQQAVYQLVNKNKSRAIMSWLTKDGPFWEDYRQHGADDWFESNGQIVTDEGLGEVAYRCFNGSDYRVFSFEPSQWQINPIDVYWHRDNGDIIPIQVSNYWYINSFAVALQSSEPPITSWQQLSANMRIHCQNLTFSANSFDYLYSQPFVDGAAKRIVELLKLLDKFKTCFDAQGRTSEGHILYQEHFTGSKAWFSDSSDDEKNKFQNELTFDNPNNKSERLVCTWHGKVKTPQIRIHFSWPISADQPLYVPYIGSKITKK